MIELQDPFRGRYSKSIDHDAGFGVDRFGALDIEGDSAADHHVGHLLLVRIPGHLASDISTLSKDSNTVRKLFHFVQLMGDDDNSLSVRAHVAQDGEEFFRLLRRQDSGGLIEDENIRSAVEGFDDLHSLLLGDRHLIDLAVWIDLEAIGVADRADALRSCRPVQTALLLQPENDILRSRKDIHQFEMLVDHTDPVAEGIPGGTDRDFLPVDKDLPFIGVVDPGKHIHEGRLSAAVFSENGEDLAPSDIQIDVIISDDRAESLPDAAQRHGWCCIVQNISFLQNHKDMVLLRNEGLPQVRPVAARCSRADLWQS